MFLVNDGHTRIEMKIRELFQHEPSVGLVIAAVFFEWSVCRAIVGLGHRPSKEMRQLIQDKRPSGLNKYAKLWAEEIPEGRKLPEIVGAWEELQAAFEARAVLVHGRDRYTTKMATPHIDVLLRAVANLWEHCTDAGVDLGKTIRRYKPKNRNMAAQKRNVDPEPRRGAST